MIATNNPSKERFPVNEYLRKIRVAPMKAKILRKNEPKNTTPYLKLKKRKALKSSSPPTN